MKNCSKCKFNKEQSEFYRSSKSKDGLSSWCKQCNKDYGKIRRKQGYKPPDISAEDRKRYKLKHRYGITPNQYNSILEEQDNKCAICKEYLSYKTINIDHCHKTGKVRGILCYSCNVGIGHLKDDPVRLLAAADYIFERNLVNEEVANG